MAYATTGTKTVPSSRTESVFLSERHLEGYTEVVIFKLFCQKFSKCSPIFLSFHPWICLLGWIFWAFASGWDRVTISHQWKQNLHIPFPVMAFKNLSKDLYFLNTWLNIEDPVENSEAFLRKPQCLDKRSLSPWITV